jgi:hypothetical protein
MTKTTIQKNIKLSIDFDTYVSTHPRMLKSIPSGAHIIITSNRDRALTEANRSIARGSRSGKFVEAHKTDGSWRISAFQK